MKGEKEMIKELKIYGDVNWNGKIDISGNTTIKNVLNEYAGGMKRKRRVELVQLGGPLGTLIRGKELNNKVDYYESYLDQNTIMFLSELMCPVDYLRFLTRYVIRELQIDTEYVRNLNRVIEKIAQGYAETEDFNELIKEADQPRGNYAEDRLGWIFSYVLLEFKQGIIEHIVQKKCHNGICRGLMVSQCMNACPAEVYIPGYIELMKQGDIENAYHLMRKNNPLSFVCGKICARPCEDRCRRGEIESTVGVRALKHYVADMALETNEFKEERAASKNKTVGIIGAGPTGLTAAYYLARTGYEVTIFEADSVVGGMLATGIPEFRLKQEAIDKEVQLIQDLGVKIKLNTKVGKDISFDHIRETFDAVLLGTGCPLGNKLGPAVPEIESAVDLLRDVKVNKRSKIGDAVVVVGGGDVAIDAARTSLRLGAKKVFLACLEVKDAMPASDEEVSDALEEGIQFINGCGVESINVVDGKLRSLTLNDCILVLDDEGRFDPRYDDGNVKILDVDNLIYAIGQKPDYSYLNDCVEFNEGRQIKVDKYTLETSLKGVFAAGDMVKSDIAIKAIEEGKKAAISIDGYLNGCGLYLGDEIEIPETPLSCTLWDTGKVVEKQNSPDVRINNFETTSVSFNTEQALKEASRCMRCDRNSDKPLFLR